jgi:drug/metabolite transporter (DMT)-like permease
VTYRQPDYRRRGFLIAKEKLSANRLVGVLIGLAGVAVIIGPEALRG